MMRNETRVQIQSKHKKKFLNGYPLIFKEALANPEKLKEEGAILNLVDNNGDFIGKGYYGRQNKGYGWVLTQDANESIDEAFFTKRIQRALTYRNAFFEDPDTTAFRIVNGEGDGLGGITIDRFNDYYLINWYSEGAYSFKNEVVNSLKTLVDFKGIYEKKRFDSKGQYVEDDDFVAGERGEFPLIVKENGVNFAVYLNEGAMVGVFLDQRPVRKLIRDTYAEGKSVLNTFSYTGAFSVFAALGGAVHTTSVDLANRSLNKTIEQFSVNGIDYESENILVMDVFKYFKYALKKNLTFDMVILDPPSFARSKKHTFSAAKDYKNLLKEAIAITEDNGIIVASTNYSGYDMKKFKGFVDQAFKESGGKYRLREEYTLPEDFRTTKEFREGNYLKVVFIEKIKG